MSVELGRRPMADLDLVRFEADRGGVTTGLGLSSCAALLAVPASLGGENGAADAAAPGSPMVPGAARHRQA